MQIINKACEKISNYISTELNLTQDKKEIINYGIFALIQMAICIIMVVIFGLLFHVLIESLLISFSVSILRKSSGGAHADSPEKCAIIGTTACIILGICAKKVTISFLNISIMSVILFVWAYYWIYKLAPVDSKNKPIRTMKKRARLKKTSMIILTIYLLIVIVFGIVFFVCETRNMLTYIMCINYGIVWQVFSLTKTGHRILAILNFNFLLERR